jgi:aspartyl-tRNA(Asn)/glutamyl-tRNA(Gln) amidotransferase subunit C
MADGQVSGAGSQWLARTATPKPQGETAVAAFSFAIWPSVRPFSGMASVDIDVKYVAHLARINLSLEEAAKLSTQLSQILEYVKKLQELDVSAIEPTAHAVPLSNVTRPDEVRPSLDHEKALRNAPAHANGLFIVSKIVE